MNTAFANAIRFKSLTSKLAVTTAIISLRHCCATFCHLSDTTARPTFSLPLSTFSSFLQTQHRSLRSMSSSTSTTTISSIYKRAKLMDDGDATSGLVQSDKIIGTHSGTFQADEAMGCWMLRQLPEYFNSRIVRSRDMDILSPLHIVIDVGGTYDHSKLRYDHHQRGYDVRFPYPRLGIKEVEGEESLQRCTKLSASGLVYLHYGKAVIQQYYPSLPPDALELAYRKLYDSLLEALDAIDTGVELVPEGVTPLYKDSTGLASRVGRLNPRWNEEDDETIDPDERFAEAVRICGIDFLSCLTAIVESDLPARAFVEEAIEKRHETCSSGEIIALPAGGMPWKNHIYDLERIHKVDPLIKFVLYEDSVGKMWRVQAVTVEGSAFTNRLGLPEQWRGVRDEILEDVTKIPGSRFVHAAGFIGGASTFEGVLQMAKMALEQQHVDESKQ